MTKNKNAAHTDANNSNMENQKKLQEIAKKSNLELKDITFNPNGYPRNVGEYLALVGFKDQQDAQLWAELTDGEFSLFFKKDGWELLVYRGDACVTDIHTLAGSYPVVFLNGNEDLNQLCQEIFGISLLEYIKDSLEYDVSENWIKAAIASHESGVVYYPLDILEEDMDFYNEVESKVRENLKYFENFKGCKGYIVIDNVNGHIEGEYSTEYPSHYYEDTKHYIFGVMYPSEREEEILKVIE